MFTGITEEIGVITRTQPGSLTFSAREVIKGTELGGSVAVNGVCLTATHLGRDALSVDIMPETLKRTNLGLLRVDSEVNLERPLTLDKPLGGHLVQGHIDGTGKVISVTAQDDVAAIRFEAPGEILRYIVDKGFIAVDGVSLTVVAADTGSFQVSLVGYTFRHTTLGKKRVGDTVNLEVDIIAKYVERMSQGLRPGITAGFLEEHGFSLG